MNSKTCKRCNSTTINSDDNFCSSCGLPLQNFCSDKNCLLEQGDNHKYLDSETRYCPVCGSESVYLELGVLSKN